MPTEEFAARIYLGVNSTIATLYGKKPSLPLARKLEVAISERHRGFLKVGEAKMYGGARPDLKESFVFGPDVEAGDPRIAGGHPMIGPNRWPAAVVWRSRTALGSEEYRRGPERNGGTGGAVA